jgi:hypothetical protein
LSYGLIVTLVGMSVYFIYGAVLRCHPSRTNMRGPRCRVLQYFHGLLIVGCWGDSSLNTDKWVMAYGSKEDLILNAMVGFHDLNDL